jgi:hypothetical protein
MQLICAPAGAKRRPGIVASRRNESGANTKAIPRTPRRTISESLFLPTFEWNKKNSVARAASHSLTACVTQSARGIKIHQRTPRVMLGVRDQEVRAFIFARFVVKKEWQRQLLFERETLNCL